MSLVYLNSSAIEAVGYAGGTLRVVFHTGRIYDHPGVPHDLFLGLLQASSAGRYYNTYIRGKFK